MIDIDVSKRVAKVAVRVVQRGFKRVVPSCFGGARTYNGSRLLESVLVTAAGLPILYMAHIKVAQDHYHEIGGDGEKVDYVGHRGA